MSKRSDKLYVDILKHGDRNIEKFLSKGASAKEVLEAWFYGGKEIDRKILYILMDRVDPSEIDSESLFFDRITKMYVEDNEIPQVVELVKKFKQPTRILESIACKYYDTSHDDLNFSLKYAEMIKLLAKRDIKITDKTLGYIVGHCSQIPFGDLDYPNRKILMNTSYNLCEILASKIEKDSLKGTGFLKYFSSPIVEEDEKSIDFIYEVCKVLMQNGSDLYGDKSCRSTDKTVDDICRKDFSGKLRQKLDDFYQLLHQEKIELQR